MRLWANPLRPHFIAVDKALCWQHTLMASSNLYDVDVSQMIGWLFIDRRPFLAPPRRRVVRAAFVESKIPFFATLIHELLPHFGCRASTQSAPLSSLCAFALQSERTSAYLGRRFHLPPGSSLSSAASIQHLIAQIFTRGVVHSKKSSYTQKKNPKNSGKSRKSEK